MTAEEACYWDAIAKVWQETTSHRLWRTHSDAVNNALFARWLPACRVKHLLKTDLFDEACSNGLYPLLASKAQSVIGIDVSISTLHAAQSRHTKLQATWADVRHLPFANRMFDVIVSNSTLDHFESLDEIIASLHELYRVLQLGGQLLLTLDNLANPVIALRNTLPFRLLNHLGIVPYYVGATCGPHLLQRILQQVGFEVLEVRGVMHCPRVFAVAMARRLERHGEPETQKQFLRLLMGFEHLAHWPTRFLTGHFVAVRAIKL